MAVDPPERVNDFETAAERIECRYVFLLLTQHLACGRSRQWSCGHAVMQSWPRAALVCSISRCRNEQAREVGCASLGSNPMRPPETPESSSASANSRESRLFSFSRSFSRLGKVFAGGHRTASSFHEYVCSVTPIFLTDSATVLPHPASISTLAA